MHSLLFLLVALLALHFCPTVTAATPLISAESSWNIHKGTNVPQAGWTTLADAELDTSWLQVPGGFGYGDPLSRQTTTLTDMQNRYSTLYIRRSFNLPEGAPVGAKVRLTIDYDDAYVAFLDGIEISRSQNAPLGIPSPDSLARSRHEASCCDAPLNPADVITITLTNQLAAGNHVLAIHGFNDEIDSSDFHLVADLALIPANECAPNTICTNTVWSSAGGPIVLANNITVTSGASLTIAAGAQVRLLPGVSLRAGAGATIDVRGTAAAPVVFTIHEGTNVWGELAADGADSSLEIRHADISGGAVQFRYGATGLIEDSYIHHYKSGSTPIAGCTDGKEVTVRRSHFNVYHETLWRFTLTTIEDSLFENANNPSSDALDFDGCPPGSVIRRSTFRHGPESNTDAIDIGSGCQGVLIEDCLMYDFPNDKGVSIGESSFGIVVRNCLIYGCESGIAVKDSCTAFVHNVTFAANEYGFRNYNKANPISLTGGGHVTNSFNNILWGNETTVSLQNAATLIAHHSDFSGTNWPGEGNISVDPLFVNPAKRDFRLATNSPVLRAGVGGTMMGAHFPVGAPMVLSHPAFTSVKLNGNQLQLNFWVDSEKPLALVTSESLAPNSWTPVARFEPRPLPKPTQFTVEVSDHPHYFQLLSE